MNRVWLGAVLGVTVGVADVLLMLPMQFQDRTGGTPRRLLRPLRPRVLRRNRAIAVAAHLGWHRGRTPDQHARRDHYQDLRADSRHGGTFRRGLWLGGRTVGCRDCMTSQK